MEAKRVKTKEELNEELYVKLSGELVDYRNELLSMCPEQMLDYAYKYAIREDIVNTLEFRDISAKQAEQLLKEENALDGIFAKWENLDTRHMDIIREAIECRANELGRDEHLKELRARKARERDER